MLQVTNKTPFKANLLLLPDPSGVDTLFTVVKATFTIAARPALADEQVQIVLADEHYGDAATTSIRVPSDVCLGKPATDVLLSGAAYAPGGAPTWQMDVSLSVGPIAKIARVFGDRVWDTSGGIGNVSWVAPFTRMPLVWGRAFGGRDLTSKGPTAEPRNPVGAGFHASGGSKPLQGAPLPNVEDPAFLVTSAGSTPQPAGFAPIAAHWEPRKQFAGTYDEVWQKTRAPYLPADFDARFFQLAPPGLIVPGYLTGGETVELRGLTPEGLLRFTLPAFRVTVVHRIEGREEERSGCLDTVSIEPDEKRFTLVWRTSLRCDKKALKISNVSVDARSMN
jgi:hypothetical protein